VVHLQRPPHDVAVLVRKLALRTTTGAAVPNPGSRPGVDVGRRAAELSRRVTLPAQRQAGQHEPAAVEDDVAAGRAVSGLRGLIYPQSWSPMEYMTYRRSDVSEELPIACTLGPDDGAERMRRWQSLAELAQTVAIRTGGVLKVNYHPGPGVVEELTALAAAEQECCSFVTWTVTYEADSPVLCVTAKADRPDDVTPIAALFGAA
jgi:hypothetical protein